MSQTPAATRAGRCLCGAVRFRAEGAPKWVAHCHCESCRRQTGAAFATYAGYPTAAVTWTQGRPAAYASSPGVTRHFCATCGTPLAYVGSRWPGEIHLFVPTFDAPAEFVPQAHVNTDEQLPWIHLADGLKRVARTSA